MAEAAPTAVSIMPIAIGLGMVPVRKAEAVMFPAKVCESASARPKLLTVALKEVERRLCYCHDHVDV